MSKSLKDVKISILPALLIALGLVVVTYLIANMTSLNVKFLQTTTLSPRPTVKTTSGYSVTALNHPNLNNNLLEIDASVKNINVKPYIVQFRLRSCNVTDDKNNQYQGGFINNGEYTFSKALLPNESGNAKIEDGFAVDGLSGNTESTFKKCNYDSNGYNVCTPVTGVKIVSCDAFVSTSWGGANNETPVKVNFL